MGELERAGYETVGRALYGPGFSFWEVCELWRCAALYSSMYVRGCLWALSQHACCTNDHAAHAISAGYARACILRGTMEHTHNHLVSPPHAHTRPRPSPGLSTHGQHEEGVPAVGLQKNLSDAHWQTPTCSKFPTHTEYRTLRRLSRTHAIEPVPDHPVLCRTPSMSTRPTRKAAT